MPDEIESTGPKIIQVGKKFSITLEWEQTVVGAPLQRLPVKVEGLAAGEAVYLLTEAVRDMTVEIVEGLQAKANLLRRDGPALRNALRGIRGD